MKNKWLIIIMVLIVTGGIGYYFWQKNQSTKVCEITNCHGLDITCGNEEPKYCDLMFGFGDGCRQYASCGKVKGKCQQIQSEKFNTCKSCAQKCQQNYSTDPGKAFDCAMTCTNNQ